MPGFEPTAHVIVAAGEPHQGERENPSMRIVAAGREKSKQE